MSDTANSGTEVIKMDKIGYDDWKKACSILICGV